MGEGWSAPFVTLFSDDGLPALAMGTIYPPVDWDGLRISVAPHPREGEVQLLGSSYSYALTVENLRRQRRSGQIALSWKLAGEVRRPWVVAVSGLLPESSTTVSLSGLTPRRLGRTEIRFHPYGLHGTFESNLHVVGERLQELVLDSPTYTLYSAPVGDRESWKAEQRGTRLGRVRGRLFRSLR